MTGTERIIMSEIKITKNFENEVNQDKPVLIDFWWRLVWSMQNGCSYHKRSSSWNIWVCKVGKVNVDEEPELLQMFKIMSIPTLY